MTLQFWFAHESQVRCKHNMHKKLMNTNTFRANIGVRSCSPDSQRMQARNKEGSVILDQESEGIFGNRISEEFGCRGSVPRVQNRFYHNFEPWKIYYFQSHFLATRGKHIYMRIKK